MMRKCIIIVLSLTASILLYQVVGNTYRGIVGVKLIGETTAHFLGYYMIAIGYFILLIINIIILMITIGYKNKKRQKQKIS